MLLDGEVMLDRGNMRVTLCLSLSKTDQKARGCRRTLACSCVWEGADGLPDRDPLRAFCIADELVKFQENRTGVQQSHPDAWTIPLIGTAGNAFEFVTK